MTPSPRLPLGVPGLRCLGSSVADARCHCQLPVPPYGFLPTLTLGRARPPPHPHSSMWSHPHSSARSHPTSTWSPPHSSAWSRGGAGLMRANCRVGGRGGGGAHEQPGGQAFKEHRCALFLAVAHSNSVPAASAVWALGTAPCCPYMSWDPVPCGDATASSMR